MFVREGGAGIEPLRGSTLGAIGALRELETPAFLDVGFPAP